MSVSVMSRFPAIQAEIPVKAAAAVQKAAIDIESNAKGVAPVDTGHLKGAIQSHQKGQFSAEVVAAADYSIYQEYGTYKMGAQPFMVPAAETVRPSFIAAMSQIV